MMPTVLNGVGAEWAEEEAEEEGDVRESEAAHVRQRQCSGFLQAAVQI